ncbi:hypothetical protein MAR_015002 [Mya arenaria]|uniref:Uncharacterized protein n=1 Tax=Mya arenaria TaxID=6604 RepID=A0ABY7FFQ8_MYAAR|nr:hypothetical protein MAR_015002 [Mya arenaria]
MTSDKSSDRLKSDLRSDHSRVGLKSGINSDHRKYGLKSGIYFDNRKYGPKSVHHRVGDPLEKSRVRVDVSKFLKRKRKDKKYITKWNTLDRTNFIENYVTSIEVTWIYKKKSN